MSALPLTIIVVGVIMLVWWLAVGDNDDDQPLY